MGNLDLAFLQPPDDREVPNKALKEASKFVDWLVTNGIPKATAIDAVRRFVDAVAGKRRQVKVSTPEPGRSPAIAALIGYYKALYVEVYGEPLMKLPDLEYMHLVKLTRDYSIQVIESRLRALASYVKEDQFIGRFGFKPSTLANQWIRVTAYAKQHQQAERRSAPADCRHSPPCTTAIDHTSRMLRDHQTS